MTEAKQGDGNINPFAAPLSRLVGLLPPGVSYLGFLALGCGLGSSEYRPLRRVGLGGPCCGGQDVPVTSLRFSLKINNDETPNDLEKEQDVIKTLHKAWPPETDLKRYNNIGPGQLSIKRTPQR